MYVKRLVVIKLYFVLICLIAGIVRCRFPHIGGWLHRMSRPLLLFSESKRTGTLTSATMVLGLHPRSISLSLPHGTLWIWYGMAIY